MKTEDEIRKETIRTLVNDTLSDNGIPCVVSYDGFPVHASGLDNKTTWHVKIQCASGNFGRMFFDESESDADTKAAIIKAMREQLPALV